MLRILGRPGNGMGIDLGLDHGLFTLNRMEFLLGLFDAAVNINDLVVILDFITMAMDTLNQLFFRLPLLLMLLESRNGGGKFAT